MDQGEKGSEGRAGKRVSLGRGRLCWSARALPNVSARFSRVKERVNKVEAKGSTPRSRGKACCHLGSGTEEEMRSSRGRLRSQCLRLAGERAERHLTEPTGFESSVANFLPLPNLHFSALSEAPTSPLTGCYPCAGSLGYPF